MKTLRKKISEPDNTKQREKSVQSEINFCKPGVVEEREKEKKNEAKKVAVLSECDDETR